MMKDQTAGAEKTPRRPPDIDAADREQAPSHRRHTTWRILARYVNEIAILLLVALFGALSRCVSPVDHCLAFDRALHEALTSHSPRGFGTVMRFGHWLSDLTVLLAPALIAWLIIRRRFGSAVVVFLSAAGIYLLHLILKGVFQRARPGDIILPDAPPSVYLFPSGHTVAAIVTVGLAAYLIADGRSRFVRRLVVMGATLFIALAVLSLVYFDNHYATDVVGGLFIGGAWLLGSIRAMRAVRTARGGAGIAHAGQGSGRSASGQS
jgi:membrane-associated phospholipid phosphatase